MPTPHTATKKPPLLPRSARVSYHCWSVTSVLGGPMKSSGCAQFTGP